MARKTMSPKIFVLHPLMVERKRISLARNIPQPKLVALMADPVTRADLDALQKALDDLTKRFDDDIADLNEILKKAKANDDRIEKKVDDLTKKVASLKCK